jgi:hypothetical protein
VPKRNCIRRAEWKLQTGKPAEALSANYRLDCDYGTAVITCWEKGGIEPIYVCESHAKELGPSREHGQEARILTTESEHTEKPTKREERSRTREAALTKANDAPLPEVAHGPEARVLTAEAEQTEKPVKREERTQTQEIAVAKPNGAPLPEAAPNSAEPKAGRAASDASARARARDLTFGNPAKAMVDEAIWNLATGDYEVYRTALQQGKSAKEAAQAAGGQLAVIHQKISDYTLKLEATLSEAKATINVGEAIDKPLEQATLEIIGNEALSDSEKDAVVQQLGAIQEWVKQGQQGEMTALQANQIILRIGERLNWGGSTEVPEELKAVYRTLHGNLKTAICAAVPKAQNFQERLINLYAAKSEIDRELLMTRELTQASR